MLQYKVYDKNMDYLTDVIDIIDNPSIEHNINGWCGVLDIKTTFPYDDTINNEWFFVDVWYYSDKVKEGTLRYRWVVTAFPTKKGDTITIRTVGIQHLLEDILYAYNATNTLENHLQAIVTKYNTEKPHDIFYLWDVDEISVAVERWSDLSLWGALNDLQEKTKFNFFIHPDGKIDFKKRTETTDHSVLMDIEVFDLDIQREDRWDIKNSIIFDDNSVIDENDSIELYTKKQYRHSAELPTLWDRQAFADHYFLSNAYPKREISCSIMDEYPIHTIYPGETITIRNTTLDIVALPIQKTVMQDNTIRCYIDKHTRLISFIK